MPLAPCALCGSARTAVGIPRRGGSSATAKAFVNSPFFFQAEDGIRDGHVTGVQTVCSSDLWCISRQRLWGVPITVLYCEKCAEPVTSPEFFNRVVEIFRREGADAWFEHPIGDFLMPGFACACGCKTFRKETDILDVWFDSGCSHIAVLKTRPELTWPAAVYLEGHDQHRGWFQSSLLVGTGIEGAAPYRQVITCGFLVNEAGDKMSK